MKRKSLRAFVGLLFISVAGCQNSAQTGANAVPSTPTAPSSAAVSSQAPAAPATDQSPEGQIRTAIQAHLAHNSNLNLKSFDTNVKQVTITGDHAAAQVEFRVKGGPGAMDLTYQLQHQAGSWAVVNSDAAGGDFSHPGLNQGQAPSGQAAAGSAPDSLSDTLRSFKQGEFATAPNPPSGHPPATQ